MTLIVHCPASDRILVDSMSTFPHGRAASIESKITRDVTGKLTYATTGSQPHGDLLIGEACSLILANKAGVFPNPGQIITQSFVRDQNGRVWHIETDKDGMYLSRSIFKHDFALGSGSNWFDAYRALGHDVDVAFRMVCNVHTSVGFPIEIY